MKIKKIVFIGIGVVFLLLLIVGFLGIRHFNQMFFKETPDYLSITTDFQPIAFTWNHTSYGNYTEDQDGIMVPVRIEGIPHNLSFQLDTGSPSTMIYGTSLDSLKERGLKISETVRDGKRIVDELSVKLDGGQMTLEGIIIYQHYGEKLDKEDLEKPVVIGTLGADFINKHITEIDFKNQFIQFHRKRHDWMTSKNNFEPFDFKGRRFMLPCEIDRKKCELFYDSGSSAFGLITTKNRYESYSKSDAKEISYDANSWGNAIPIKNRSTDEMIEITGLEIPLKRVSYIDMYSELQGPLSMFTRIGGWLGNRPFMEHSLIFDIPQGEFTVLRKEAVAPGDR